MLHQLHVIVRFLASLLLFLLKYTVCVIVISCPVLHCPIHGNMSTNISVCNTTVHFGCDDCYFLVGHSNLTCDLNGQWDGSPPSCESTVTHLLAVK